MSSPNHTPGQHVDEQRLTDALRNADPEATVSIESATGQLKVSTVLGEHEVLEILGGLGMRAAASDKTGDAGHQGGQCCGGCS